MCWRDSGLARCNCDMSGMDSDKQRLRSLPSVDRVLRETPHLAERWGHERVTAATIRNDA